MARPARDQTGGRLATEAGPHDGGKRPLLGVHRGRQSSPLQGQVLSQCKSLFPVFQ